MNKTRCINIDWLEVHAIEPNPPITPDYLREKGYWVQEREYGTRVYRQMFTIMGEDGLPSVEVRRDPASRVLPDGSTHLRLVNRVCYADAAARRFADFITSLGYTDVNVSRIDICLDFEKFDYGDYPAEFVRRYMQSRYCKINISNIRAYGKDEWTERTWNSLSWGSPKSQVSTKMYCKSLELEEVKDKPYIRQAWFLNGLVDDPVNLTKRAPDGKTYKPSIWRLEFSIKSSVKRWFVVEEDGKKRSIRNTLAMYETPQDLLAVFSSLVPLYFHFKVYEQNKRKYDCKDKLLFNFGASERTYTIEHPADGKVAPTVEQRLLKALNDFKAVTPDVDACKKCDTLLDKLEEMGVSRIQQRNFDKSELTALRIVIAKKIDGDETDPAVLLRLVLDEIKANQGQALFT